MGNVGFDLFMSPNAPRLEDQLLMLGGPWRDLAMDDRWILTSGLVPRAVYYSPEQGLIRMGGHDLNPWVEGRELRGDEAYRVDDWF